MSIIHEIILLLEVCARRKLILHPLLHKGIHSVLELKSIYHYKNAHYNTLSKNIGVIVGFIYNKQISIKN